MKTQFSRRHPNVLSPARIGGAVLVLCIVLLLVLRWLFPNTFVLLVTPLWQSGSALTHALSFESTAALVQERDRLVAENESLTQQLLLLQSGAKVPEGIAAGVLARPPVTAYDVLVIGEGTDSGVSMNALVYTEGGIPLGVIADAGKTSARVVLFSSFGRETEGWVGEDRYPVTFVGEGAGTFHAQVPREAPINEGDSVYFAGPGSLPVGFIAHVQSHACAPEATLSVRPVVNVFSVTRVIVRSVLP